MTKKTSPVSVKTTAAPPARVGFGMFDSLHREIDRLFDQFGRSGGGALFSGGAAVRMDMAETEKGLELTAELPGLEEKDIQVSLTDHMLTVSGEKRAEKEEKDKDYYFAERSYGAFSRSVELPADAELDKIEASMSNGVLKVTVPRTAKAAPKTIAVKSAA